MTLPPLDLDSLPGHDIRRLHQIAVALFMQETESFGITPVQFAALQAVHNVPGTDQRTLARTIGFDTSTIAGVIDRLEARGLVERRADPRDRRIWRLHLTDEADPILQDIETHRGAVADFITMSCCGIENPYSFNIADVAIFVGALGLVLFTGKKKSNPQPKPRKTP